MEGLCGSWQGVTGAQGGGVRSLAAWGRLMDANRCGLQGRGDGIGLYISEIWCLVGFPGDFPLPAQVTWSKIIIPVVCSSVFKWLS